MQLTASTKVLDVAMGSARFSSMPGERLRARDAGSGLVVTLHDPAVPLGAMMHLLLPDSRHDKIGREHLAFRPYKYVDTAVPLVLQRFWDAGGRRERMRVGVFGGARLADEPWGTDLGFRNFTALRYVFWKNRVRVDLEHTGGPINRSVRLDIETGRLELLLPDGKLQIFEQEEESWS